MKTNRSAWVFALCFFGATTFHVSAQRAATTTNYFDEIKAKAEAGDANAQDQLGNDYEWGINYSDGSGTTTNLSEAAKWYRKAADQGRADAQLMLGSCYENGSGVSKDLAEAAKWYRKAAEQGDEVAQYSLGICYDRGDGVAKDLAEAARWRLKAAEQGFKMAQLQIGIHYENGEGVPQDYVEAYKWSKLGGRSGDYLSFLENKMTPDQIAEGQRRVAAFKPQKEKEASKVNSPIGVADSQTTDTNRLLFESFKDAAEQGDASSECFLGGFYRLGIGVTKDEAEGVKWTRKAAEQGYAEAEYDLGNCYYTGNGVSKDGIEATKWYRRAAEQGFEKAQYNLGSAYVKGDGVVKDYVEAYKWFNLASAQGDEDAKKYLLIFEQHLTPEQIAKGQELSRAFTPRKESVSTNSVSP